MRVLITGIDGYLGWSLAVYLAAQEGRYQIAGIDNFSRRRKVLAAGGQSAIAIPGMRLRLEELSHVYRAHIRFYEGDLTDYLLVRRVLERFRPGAIVYLGEQPSAPWSMRSVQDAAETQTNNVIGTLTMLWAMRHVCPTIHLIKIGTMGEYGTPNLDIPEGEFELEYRGRKDRVLFPRRAGSWYHVSKVHDTHNVEMACRLWGLRSTDIMQGVVYGTRIRQMGSNHNLATRFDFDECFGTVINRFCAQAVINAPLTVYGTGGQWRGFLPLCDVMQCLQIALDNPPAPGEYRTWNQFEEIHSVLGLAARVQRIAREFNIGAAIERLDNPRIEAEQHYYRPVHQKLFSLGYKPTQDLDGQLRVMLSDLIPNKERIRQCARVLVPRVRWI